MSKIIIIGCGIGGATAALALHRAGHEVRVFERAEHSKEVGAGIGLLPNALLALDALALDDSVKAQGQLFSRAKLCTERGDNLQEMDLAGIVGIEGGKGCVIHRARLLSLVLKDLPKGIITTRRSCISLEQTGHKITVGFENKEREQAEIVIGADGINSTVRSLLFGDSALRYSGQTCFRGIAYHSIDEPDTVREVQGAGKRCSVMSIGNGQVYWWAAVNAKPKRFLDALDKKRFLLDNFRNWPFGIVEALHRTKSQDILQNDLVDRLPLKRWTKGRITLLGDAAHPMVPNLGQGACTALEDAVLLTLALKHYEHDLNRALLAYEKARIKRTSMISTMSWLYGIPCTWTHPRAVALRELLTKRLPTNVVRQTFGSIFRYDAGKARF